MNATIGYRDYWINPRIKITALWASTLLIFAFVDLFSLYREDVRADIESGKIADFSIGQGFLLGVTVYVVIPSLMVFLSLVLPARVDRITNMVLAVVYGLSIAANTIGEWNYYILGSVVEIALLICIVHYARTWPKIADPEVG